ncbi:MAG: putative xylanase/chitin deacetylase [Caldanaerobacter subterraneus]|jgi:peptidoglycan-N-acetylmuramic acid deacetylase|uniref:Delta-lactam-biosynthetic de-N-acetylase n=2 Tax=Caldanaerobacter subterraneus TaxID=911092 RepID=A0A101E6S2_9THEO|nr:delta-lactam-biosynthetic de-N-acetylase [Caldanaerobacter subterraneus]ERM92054.1 xylanase [Caldanaerobacter subterraneus subsp. yonseiensis KB-1]KUK09622.1 MAG: putative xylanase/chitin deacetylase [Caldanaerobacter subterraneus]NNG66352.1 delta-lactam-biosynthetic de-N-acetylase [Caldanaerobacter subterraneus]HBT48802.1 delta-lactam-biosynthetic de-N-acetylase [Caldanaerobacter subterraneus]
MAKKIISLAIGIALCFSLVSCGIIKKNSNENDKAKIQEEALHEPFNSPKEEISNVVNHVVQKTENLDNTPYGWGLRVLPNHQTPEITPYAMELVKKYNAIFVGDTTKKVVYLTFDEGYEAGYTPRILDVLKENGVKAAFFVTGPYVKQQADLVKRMVEEGHIVGNHTVNHPSLPTLPDEKVKEEILGLEKMFEDLTGQKMKYFRPPRGEYSERTLYITKSLGYRTVFWSLAMADWQPLPGGPEESYSTVMKRLHPGAVILLHAVSKDNAQALDRIIKSIKEEGYEFKTLDDIP